MSRFWQGFILFLLSLIWGSSFILMKKGLESFDQYQVAALRIFLSFVFFLPLSLPRIKQVKKEDIRSLLIVGFIGNFFPAFLFTRAQTQIDSSLAGILNSCTPLFTMLTGMLLYKQKISGSKITGLILGLAGVSGLLYKKEIFMAGNHYGYALFILLATFFYGISMNETRARLHSRNGVYISSMAFLFTGPVAGIYLLHSGLPDIFSSPAIRFSFGSIVLLSFFGSFIASILFNELVRKTSAITGSVVTYLIPVFAIIWGISDGEDFRLIQLVWALVILGGVGLVRRETGSGKPRFSLKKSG